MSAHLYVPFVNSTKDMLKQMADIDIAVSGTFQDEEDSIASYGVSSIISFAGKVKGRFLLDMEPGVALTIAQNITGVYYNSPKDNMVLASISELNNTIAGDGITNLNNTYSLSLRLAPPVVFTGKDTVISIPKIPSASLHCTTRYGKLRINVAFERSL